MFYVGQKVVCVGWPWRGWRNWLAEKLHPYPKPVIGQHFIVSNVILRSDRETSIELLEFPSPETKIWDAGFLASGFRPLVEQKTDISVFKALLNPANHHEHA